MVLNRLKLKSKIEVKSDKFAGLIDGCGFRFKETIPVFKFQASLRHLI